MTIVLQYNSKNKNTFALQKHYKCATIKAEVTAMENFPQYYTRLFNGITDALEALEKQNYIAARDILIKAQQDAEEMYISAEEE